MAHHQLVRVSKPFRDHPTVPNQGHRPPARDTGLKEPPPPSTLMAEAAPPQGGGWGTTSLSGSVNHSEIIPLSPTRVIDHQPETPVSRSHHPLAPWRQRRHHPRHVRCAIGGGGEGLVHHQHTRVGQPFRDHSAAPNQGRRPLARDTGLKEPPPPSTLMAEAAPSQAREVCRQRGGGGVGAPPACQGRSTIPRSFRYPQQGSSTTSQRHRSPGAATP